MDDALSMEQVAKAVGLSRERFRKVWQGWLKAYGFPAPFRKPVSLCNGAPRGSYAWRPAAVDEWIKGREAALGGAEVEPRPLNDNPRPGPAGGARLERERAALREMIRSNQA